MSSQYDANDLDQNEVKTEHRGWNAETGVWENSKASADHGDIPDPLWIFGYGSLCWNVGDLPYLEKRIALLEGGWIRRFYQKSMDHRGTPSQPGLTLLNEAEKSEGVIGVAYRIASEQANAVLDSLDFREKGGYSRFSIQVKLGKDGHFKENIEHEIVNALVYTGTTDNPNFITKTLRDDIGTMAKIIADAVGPSGPNCEYLFKLADFAREVGVVDRHLIDLEQRVRELMNGDD